MLLGTGIDIKQHNYKMCLLLDYFNSHFLSSSLHFCNAVACILTMVSSCTRRSIFLGCDENCISL